jgi:transcriptional regulator with XRE-family HTH domain
MLVGARLRELRQNAGISLETAGAAIRASDSKISRLERGRTGFSQRDVADLLTCYGVTDAGDRRVLLDLAEQANVPGWWQSYADVLPDWFEPYLGLEPAASLIRTYAVQFIPDLLQSEEYAKTALWLSHLDDTASQIARRVELRLRRQQILNRPAPPRLWAVIDETALRRPIGSPDTMRAQLTHLIELAARPNITVQLVPFSAGGHPAAGGSITFLRFPEGVLPDVVYREQDVSAVYVEKPADIAHYWSVLNGLGLQAAEPDETVQILHEIRAEISAPEG